MFVYVVIFMFAIVIKFLALGQPLRDDYGLVDATR